MASVEVTNVKSFFGTQRIIWPSELGTGTHPKGNIPSHHENDRTADPVLSHYDQYTGQSHHQQPFQSRLHLADVEKLRNSTKRSPEQLLADFIQTIVGVVDTCFEIHFKFFENASIISDSSVSPAHC